MAVGASFADLAVILVDATKGLLAQTRRHARICSLMGIGHFVFAVNKMDLTGYDEAVFEKVRADIATLENKLGLLNSVVIPVSATEGGNVAAPSEHMPWYGGPTLLSYLESVNITRETPEAGFYMPVQRVSRPSADFRGFQGQIESGEIRAGESVTVLPGGEAAIVKSILAADREAPSASAGQAVTIRLDREVDVSRGSVVERGANLSVSRAFTATLLWMDEDALAPEREGRAEYWAKIGTRLLPCAVESIRYKTDVNTGRRDPASELRKNEIGLCEISLSHPAVIDAFRAHRTMGELILIDRVSHATAACGVVETVSENAPGEGAETGCPLLRDGGFSVPCDFLREFYFNLSGFAGENFAPRASVYDAGDELPLRGESFAYPRDFDVILADRGAAARIRDGRLAAAGPLRDYVFRYMPIVDGKGFAIRAETPEDFARYLDDFAALSPAGEKSFFEKWLDFGRYRVMIFHSGFWAI
jgi:sulfate adenylyltransferase subunit 1